MIDLYDEYLGREYYIDPVSKESQWEHPNMTGGKSSSGRKAAGGGEVQVLHILAKHTGSRNPKNYKGETITRSKDDARKKIDGLSHSFHSQGYSSDVFTGIIDQLNDADDLEETFRRIAKDHSDCSSGQRGGKIFD